MKTIYISLVLFISLVGNVIATELEEDPGISNELYKIEGKLIRPDSSNAVDHEWFGNVKIFTNTGYVGFIREDGTFVINNVPWGSHVIQVMNPSYHFESARVDISSKGKMRARAINHIQPSKVDLMVYPLRLKSLGPMRYFQQREQWRITDLLLNPMVLMTILPLAFMMVIPRLGDADTRKEMEQFQMPKMETPELSEIVTNFFGGSSSSSSTSMQQNKAKLRSNKRKDK